MTELPAAGISAQEFMEGWFPKAFAEEELPEGTKQVELTLGVRLTGDGGGDWLFHLKRGELQVEASSIESAAFALIQSLEDWRSCLWGERGGAFGRQAALLFQPGAATRAAAASEGGSARPLSPVLIAQLQTLNGVLRMVVTGGERGDWKVDFKLGAGPVPEAPSTTVTVNAADAAAMERGQLDLGQAFVSGRLQVAGDLGFLLQMQAIQMQASAKATGA
jgi:hypothetical protein